MKYLVDQFVIPLIDSLITFPNLGSSPENLVLGASSSWLHAGSPQPRSIETSLITFVTSRLINSDAFRRRVMLFNTSSQDYVVLLATVPSGPFVNLHDQLYIWDYIF